MAKQEKRMKHLLLDILMLVSLLPMGGSQVAQAQGIPEPFPEDCDDITPVADACCMRGYVYYGGAPVDAADVHIESAYGQVDLATASGGESTDPYYSVVLSDAPLSLSPGEVITITASYSDMVSTRTWTVQSNGQHVDLGLVAGYQAAEPVPIETGADRSQDGAGNWGQVKQLTASGGAVYGILDESVAASSVPAAPQLMHFEAGGHVPGIEPTRLYLDALDHALSAEFLNTAVGACDSHYALTTGPTYVWHTFYGSGARDGAGAIAADGSGNIYIVGTSYATWQGDGGANPLHAYGGGPNDIVVTKLNSSGAYQWHTFYGAGGDDRGHAIAVDGSGNVYVTGLSSSTWQGDGGANPLHAFSGGEYDIVVLKLNSDGDYQWHTFYGPSGWGAAGQDILLDGSDNVYIAGYSNATWQGYGGANPLHAHSGSGQGDITVLKLTSSGGYWWHTFYGSGVADESSGGIAIDGSNNVYIAGRSLATWQGDGGANPLHTYSGGFDIVALKLNSSGAYQWHTFYGSDSADWGAIAVDGSDNVYVTGYSEATWQGDGGTNPLHTYSASSDIVVVKLNSSGNYQWHTFYGAGGDDGAGHPILDGSGNIYVAGSSDATWQGDGGANPLHTWSGGYDIVVLKLNSSGAYQWHTFYGAGGDDRGGVITLVGSGNIYIAGNSLATWQGDGGANPLHAYSGDWDIVVVKLAVAPAAPTAAFTASPLSGSAPLTVTFTDQSTGDIISWDWTFGDGSISGARHPAHIYETAGTNTVSLTITGPGGSDTETKPGYISVNSTGVPVASINYIWPNPATQGQDTIYLNGNGYDTDEGGAYITAYVWNSSMDGELSSQEDFTVPASELSSGTHSVSFKCQDDEGEWSEEVTRTLTVSPPVGDVRTLILVNRQKLEDLYSAAEASQVMTKLNDLAAQENVDGLVVQVEEDAAVAAAYAAWDADPTDTAKANAVTAAIKAVVAAEWAAHPELEYLVVAGDDRTIPFHRVLDQTRHPESKYRSVSCNSTTGAALCDDMTLTDDYYADAEPTVPEGPDWDGHDLYLPDLGSGRLIESPNEIIAQIDTFLASDAEAADGAVVTGYDFVEDGAQAICAELSGDGIPSDCTLVGQTWDRDDFIAQVLDTRHDLTSINGHASHYGIGTPSGQVYSSDVAAASADHTRALFYTVGCHSGLNVPPTNPTEPLDTAQALVQQGANYVANTGYGWGYVTTIGLSEQLMLDFTERLIYGQSATVGQALAAAKQEYYLDDGDLDYYDEKILIESTLYGLPMYRYTTPTTAARLPTQDLAATVLREEQMTVLGDGLTMNSLFYQFPALLAASTDDGQYYSLGDLVHASDGEPIQPKYVADLSFPQTEAHGVMFRGGAYADETTFNPVVDRAITETATLPEPSFDALTWYPPVLQRLNRLERGDKLVTLLGQFNPQSQTERVYDRLRFDVYYHVGSDDWLAPSIACVRSRLDAGTAQITLRAEDASGIHAVVVAYTDGLGEWDSVSLAEGGGLWSGSFPASTGSLFFIQVADEAGNVGVDHKEWQYYRPGEGSCSIVYLPLVRRTP